jgi:hypothetical protein
MALIGALQGEANEALHQRDADGHTDAALDMPGVALRGDELAGAGDVLGMRFWPAIPAATSDGSILSEPVPEADAGGLEEDAAPVAEALSPMVTLTFYVCSGAPYGYQDGYCGTMSSGTTVYEGAAACGYSWELGTRFVIDGDPTGRVYTCEDRGYLDWFHVDVFFWDYAEGRAWRNGMPLYATVRLV